MSILLRKITKQFNLELKVKWPCKKVRKFLKKQKRNHKGFKL